MKKTIAKLLAILLCAVLLGSTLSGCGLLKRFGISLPELPFGNKTEKPSNTQYTLSQATDFYAQPDWDSQLLATYYAGYAVTYTSVVTVDGCTWAQAEEGWFVLDGTKPDQILNAYDVDKKGFATEATVTYDAPSVTSAAYDRLAAGAPVQISQIVETEKGFWVDTNCGWVSLDNIYIAGETGQHHGYGVCRENVSFFSAPGVQSDVTATANSGTRFEILEQIQIDNYRYGYTADGWVFMESVYVEGTEGQRPCYVMVIDSTPLNVRLAPGTDNEVLDQLHYGDYVDILERVERNGNDWGYTGEGWIFMDLTQVQ